MREDIKRRIEQIRRGEVPEGYKNVVDYHIIPKDWRIKKLEDLGSLKNGINKDKDMFGNGYPLVNLDDVFASKCISSTSEISTLVFCSEQERASYSLRNGDIVFVRSSVKKEGVGLTAYVTEDLSDTVFSGFLIRFRCLSDSLVGSYKVYCFDSTYFRDQLLKKSTVSANTNINQEQLKILKIALPSTNEQEQIAEILSTCDRVIELKKKLVEEKIEIKKWLMQTLLTGMIRVKDIENRTPYEELKKRIEQIRSGQVNEGYDCHKQIDILPKNWRIKSVGEVVRTIVGGGTPSRRNAKYYEGHIPWVTVKDLNCDFYKYDATEHITPEAIEKSASKFIESGNVIVSTRMGLGRGFINKVPMAINQDMKALLLKTEANAEFFLYWYLNVGRKIAELGGGSTVKGISLKTLRSIKLPFPPKDEQTQIAAILSTADKEIDLLNKDLEQWELKKKSLMQLLLTGIVRTKA